MTEQEMSQHLHGGLAPHRGGWEGTVTIEGAREVSPVWTAPIPLSVRMSPGVGTDVIRCILRGNLRWSRSHVRIREVPQARELELESLYWALTLYPTLDPSAAPQLLRRRVFLVCRPSRQSGAQQQS